MVPSDTDRAAELRRLAHDVRNALNGIAVNLEVARSRALRGVDVAEIAPFIETASQQLDAAARLHKRYADAASALAASVASSSRPDADPALTGTMAHIPEKTP
ncbi:MAG: hypothetical protein ABI194_04035 [Gemmatimonadaceae bacterium]